jgi:hypothetical protein
MNPSKVTAGFLILYGIYKLRNLCIKIKIKTRILFEHIWNNIIIVQETNRVEFQKMLIKHVPYCD